VDALCSARLLEPFKKFVSGREAHRDLVPDVFWSVPGDARVSLNATHAMLDRGVERLRDEQLGLKLGATMRFGNGGAYDYAVRSAPTVRESFDVASKYTGLLSDSFVVGFESHHRQALVRLDDTAPWPRSAADFAMSAFYTLHVSEPLRGAHVECWFPYTEPEDLTDYRDLFAGATLKFGAPFYGFAFDESAVDVSMPGSDAALHVILRARVDTLMAELRASRPLSASVRRLIADEIPSGTPTADHVARALHMSRRTMTRRLEQERTSFHDELDTVRRERALDLVREGKVSLIEAAFLSGFSHVESFHRAFKRWTGHTPVSFRAVNLAR
jgi:AraC-like DNA-binding protein